MKTKCLTKFIALACLCMLFSACDDDDSDPVIIDKSYISINFADFTVTNVTTREQAVNEGIVIIGESNSLKVRKGDVLRLSYNPPAEYKDFSWTVEYALFDETFTVNQPYTMEYTVKDVPEGEYYVTCAGSVNDDNVEGHDTGNVTLRVVNK